MAEDGMTISFTEREYRLIRDAAERLRLPVSEALERMVRDGTMARVHACIGRAPSGRSDVVPLHSARSARIVEDRMRDL